MPLGAYGNIVPLRTYYIPNHDCMTFCKLIAQPVSHTGQIARFASLREPLDENESRMECVTFHHPADLPSADPLSAGSLSPVPLSAKEYRKALIDCIAAGDKIAVHDYVFFIDYHKDLLINKSLHANAWAVARDMSDIGNTGQACFIKQSVQRFYLQKNLLARVKNAESAMRSIDFVMNKAFQSSKRLFLHKLRDCVIEGHSVQQIYVLSKADRYEGIYAPIEHDLLSNFAWLYAGIRNSQLSKKSAPKAINLMLTLPIVDKSWLFRQGERSNGLSALGYELAFLQVAGFRVERTKLDVSISDSELTRSNVYKIKLVPPSSLIACFAEIMCRAATGFMHEDFSSADNKAKDVTQFLAAVKHDPNGWGTVIRPDV